VNTGLLIVYSSGALFIIVSSLFLLLTITIKRFLIVSPVNAFVLYYSLLFALFPVISFSTGITTFPMFNTNDYEQAVETAKASLYAAGVIIAIALGFFLGSGSRGISRVTFRQQRASDFARPCGRLHAVDGSVSLAGLIAWGAAATLSLAGFISIFYSVGGVGAYADRFVEFRYIGQPLPGFIIYFSTIVPGYLGLLMLIWYKRKQVKGRMYQWLGFGSVMFSLFSIAVCGFRINMVPLLWAAVALYHFEYARVGFRRLTIYATTVILALGFLGFARERFERGDTIMEDAGVSILNSVVMPVLTRVPGTEMHRIVRDRISAGLESHGVTGPLIESATIIVPRWFWQNKPPPQSLEFGYVFLGDYLSWRNRGEMSEFTGGFSPTFGGYMLWLGGDVFCIAGSILFGFLCGCYQVLLARFKSLSSEGATFSLGIGSQILKFAEAPQDALNGTIMIGSVLLLTLAPIRFFRRTTT
jgi:hypothetical protein